MWTVGRCIVYPRNRLLLHIHPFISSFFFLSNFQTLKVFVTVFSGPVRPRRLKLGTHMDSGEMCRIYWNQAAALICPFIFHFSFSPIFKHENFSSHFSQELWGLEGWHLLHVENGRMYRVYQNHAAALICPLIFSFFLFSSFQTLKNFLTLFSGIVRPRRLKLGTQVDSGQMYRVYRNQAADGYLSLFFIFLSLQFSYIEIFCQLFL